MVQPTMQQIVVYPDRKDRSEPPCQTSCRVPKTSSAKANRSGPLKTISKSILRVYFMSPRGSGLPLRIPAAGHRAIDLVLEGKLSPNPTGGAAAPVHYRVTLESAGARQVVEGQFDDTLKTQRLGRRGTTVVHQSHSSELRVLANPGREDLSITQLSLEPPTAPAVTVSAFAHPLPGPVILGIAVAALLAGVIAFDRLAAVAATDGALTLATAAVVGAAVIFWTSNAVHPDFRTLIGSAIFGGPVGFAAGALLWWAAKKLIARPGR